MSNVTALEAQHVLQTYKRQPVVFVRGEGTRLFDENGRAYLDFISGIGVVRARPRASGARGGDRRPGEDADPHVEPLLPPAAGPARREARGDVGTAAHVLLQQRHRGGGSVPEVRAPLLVLEGRSRTGRSTSRSSTASRAARWARCRSRRTRTIASRSSRSIPGVTFVAPDDITGLEAAVTEQTAAIIAEPIQGEGGVRPLSPEFAAAIARVTKATGTLLIADEIQCGLGRTGRPFHFQSLGLDAGPGHGRQGDRLGHSDRRGARRRARRRRRSSRAITARPTAATCCRRARRSTCSTQLDALAPHIREAGALFEQKLIGAAAAAQGDRAPCVAPD